MDEPLEIEVGTGTADQADVGAARRRRAVTGVVAAMLVAGSGGLGFGLGRSFSDDGSAPAATPASTTPATVAPASTLPPAPTVPPTTAAAAADVADAPAGTVAPQTAGGVTASILPGTTGAVFEVVWEGVTDSGYRLRLQAGPPFDEGYGEGFGEWRPAPFCWATEQMRVTLDGPDVVDASAGAFYAELYGRAETVFTGDLGVNDGRPVRVAVIQVADDVTEVQAEWTDGVTASSPVVGGVAVLSAETAGGWEQQLTLELVSADGTRESVAGGYIDRNGDPTWRAACTPPPPALPDAGERPADPEAARTEIEARLDLLWDQSVDRADKPVLLDDDTGVDDALAALQEGAFAATAATAQFSIEELVFTAPDRAWFRYAIDTDVTFFADRYGVAKLTGDGWIFPRALLCQDLGLAGANCEPTFEQIYPPSFYVQYDSCGPDDGCPTFESSAIASW